MTAVRVYVATTDGPSEIQRIAEEDPEVRSVVCLNGTSEALPISAAYDAFVRKPTGIIERLFGHPVFRMDVATRISDGRSWQLGVFAAHALRAVDRLAQRNAPAGRAVWLTGTVDSDLKVGPVDHVAEKLKNSQPLFAKLRAEGVPVTVFLPTANADQGTQSAIADHAGGGEGFDVVLVENADALCRNLGLPRVARGAVAGRARRSKRRVLVAAAVAVLTAGALGAVHLRDDIGQWLGALWPTATPGGNGGPTAGSTPVVPQSAPAAPAATPAVAVTPSSPGPAAPTPTPDTSVAEPKPETPVAATPVATAPDPAPAPSAGLAAADIRVSAVEWRAKLRRGRFRHGRTGRGADRRCRIGPLRRQFSQRPVRRQVPGGQRFHRAGSRLALRGAHGPAQAFRGDRFGPAKPRSQARRNGGRRIEAAALGQRGGEPPGRRRRRR